ncbi:MAG: DM13 domain-containing protein [Cyanobacteria bacterium CRU_2_1]|nr:DM13 domain-containing protein [Cyanobacteria bacterium RU_5_0]NJR58493.1 DM13 domain-containing protein [Cyanobacteria bacterium CRU_2_1]NJR58509.1 DM13 domain-containing protein [Cyanobacteria bacterium CRU_2_1]
MKVGFFNLKSVVPLGIISTMTSVLLMAIGSATIANPSTEAPSSVTSDQVVAQERIVIDATGTFVAAEAPTTGTARIVEEGGQRYLELDSAFSTTDEAPDLHVLLEVAEVPPSSYSDFGSYINLGSLEQFNGSQRYPIPDAIDVSEFKSVVIWCRMVNVTMGYASLEGDNSANAQ